MDNRSEQKAENSPLYPAIDPFSQEMLDVGDGHKVYLEQSGARDGYPVVVVHGGPGAGVQRVNAPIFRSDQISHHHV